MQKANSLRHKFFQGYILKLCRKKKKKKEKISFTFIYKTLDHRHLLFYSFPLGLRIVDSNIAYYGHNMATQRSDGQEQSHNTPFTVSATPYNSSLQMLASVNELFWKQALARYNPTRECLSAPMRKTTASRFHPSMDLTANRQGLCLKILPASPNPQCCL